MPGRRDEVLDAAVRVLGTKGLRGLTYQAVDRTAGAPAGTTSNHFRSHDLLVTGVVAHLETLDARDWRHFAATAPAGDPEALTQALARVVGHMLGPARHRTAARYALALEGIARPAVREAMSRARTSMIELTSAWLAELGSPAPLDHCTILFDYLDGFLFHQLATAHTPADPEPGIRALLGAFLASPAQS
ncbi:TetR/AcrR family transcriptional regulator [Streptomyces luteolus]|uniref:TetR family transcriptional regulator n=1 Tax=Streptomyces luteolus TaxID=3043615 RepID=A0ABT6SRB2_9ACTN|nr:TetR/AcrR family transcriptional regulator [Streptomyces sp. B-S-A12]MDI3417653.1 TetR family transcriptional regulator [Streptomyces sp. B-S-A12]